jgi:hypothetical protein
MLRNWLMVLGLGYIDFTMVTLDFTAVDAP